MPGTPRHVVDYLARLLTAQPPPDQHPEGLTVPGPSARPVKEVNQRSFLRRALAGAQNTRIRMASVMIVIERGSAPIGGDARLI
jgi:hypothetical protein